MIAGNRVTAGKAVVATRQMAVMTAFQFDFEMLTDWWLPLLVPIRVYFSRLRLRHLPDLHAQKITTIC